MLEPLVFVISQAADGYRWRLCGERTRVIAVGPSPFANLAQCRDEVELVKGSWVAGVELAPVAGTEGEAARNVS